MFRNPEPVKQDKKPSLSFEELIRKPEVALKYSGTSAKIQTMTGEVVSPSILERLGTQGSQLSYTLFLPPSASFKTGFRKGK